MLCALGFIICYQQSVDTTELYNSTKKRQHYFDILKAFFVRHSSEYQSIKRFGDYPTFYTLMSVGRKKLSVCQNNVAAFSCCCKISYKEFSPPKHFLLSLQATFYEIIQFFIGNRISTNQYLT